ncbi:MAG TPA: RlmE family RNA methyltransferase [Geminicoccaceae bacterium]|nr:RlmE family RNA methyltransferase [Geminicoccaceae bacterium]
MASGRRTRVRVRGKGRRAGSTRWLERHLNDPYVQSARQAGYRARAAFKLLEIDRRFGVLKPGSTVVDLGSAPGSWAQVAAARGCRVIGLDRLEVAPIPGATLLQGDVFDPETSARLRAAAGGPADVVLSDMAASSTGQRAVDRLRAEAIGEAVLDLLPVLLAPGGGAVIKLVRGAESGITAAARRVFARVQLARPEATHRGSSEIYLVAQGYRAPA